MQLKVHNTFKEEKRKNKYSNMNIYYFMSNLSLNLTSNYKWQTNVVEQNV